MNSKPALPKALLSSSPDAETLLDEFTRSHTAPHRAKSGRHARRRAGRKAASARGHSTTRRNPSERPAHHQVEPSGGPPIQGTLDRRGVNFFRTEKSFEEAVRGIIMDTNLGSHARSALLMLRAQSCTFVPRVGFIRGYLGIGTRGCVDVMKNLKGAGYCFMRHDTKPGPDGKPIVAGRQYVFYDSPQEELMDPRLIELAAKGKCPFKEGLFRNPADPYLKFYRNLEMLDTKDLKSDSPHPSLLRGIKGYTKPLPPLNPPEGEKEIGAFSSENPHHFSPAEMIEEPRTGHMTIMEARLAPKPEPHEIPEGYQALEFYPSKLPNQRYPAFAPRYGIQPTSETMRRRHEEQPLNPEKYWQHRQKAAKAKKESGQVREKTMEALLESNRKRDMLQFCEQDPEAQAILERFEGARWTKETANKYVRLRRYDRIKHAWLDRTPEYASLEDWLQDIFDGYGRQEKLREAVTDPVARHIHTQDLKREIEEHYGGTQPEVRESFMRSYVQLPTLSQEYASAFVRMQHNPADAPNAPVDELRKVLCLAGPDLHVLTLVHLLASYADIEVLRSIVSLYPDVPAGIRANMAQQGALIAIIDQVRNHGPFMPGRDIWESLHYVLGDTEEDLQHAIALYRSNLADRVSAIGSDQLNLFLAKYDGPLPTTHKNADGEPTWEEVRDLDSRSE